MSGSRDTTGADRPVLVLGGGINGCALARELTLNGVPVWLVEANDLAFGATSRSSRLIHGGLRYLEYGGFRLVRESLDERSRLRRLAPQFVEPLRLYIPVSNRLGGTVHSLFRFFGSERRRLARWLTAPFPPARGRWLVQAGLTLYDYLARERDFPPHGVHDTAEPGVPAVDRGTFHWLCAYTDARMLYPERFTIALLEDARQLAGQQGADFRVFTYHHVSLHAGTVKLRPRDDIAVAVGCQTAVHELRPSLIVNATGAWGDRTLEDLHVPSRRLFGGTKGSHLITRHPQLRQALGGAGVYAEAADGRLVFVLPFGESVLVGTTDERFDDSPDRAVATERELDYLVGMVNEVFAIRLTRADIDLHYSGVRPLPYAHEASAGAITRDHWAEVNEEGEVPVLTLIGGKLTTCRAFAEQVADLIFERLGRQRTADTRERPVPGGTDYPADAAALSQRQEGLARSLSLSLSQVRAVWSLCGNRIESMFHTPGLTGKGDRHPCAPGPVQPQAQHPGASPPFRSAPASDTLAGTDLPLGFVRHVIGQEWVTTLNDLIERRLMLLYQPDLSQQCLEQLADALIAAGRLDPSRRDAAVQSAIDRLRSHYGKRVVSVSLDDSP